MFRIACKLTGAKITVGIAILCFLSPLALPKSVLPFGFSFFFCWAALCVASVLANRLLLWAFLSCTALALVSIDWWMHGPPETDDFGFGALDAIILFVATALVVGMTGTLSIVRAAIQNRTGR